MSTERSTVEGDRTLVLVAYVLHLVGAVAGLTSIVGLMINYVNRDRRRHVRGLIALTNDEPMPP